MISVENLHLLAHQMLPIRRSNLGAATEGAIATSVEEGNPMRAWGLTAGTLGLAIAFAGLVSLTSNAREPSSNVQESGKKAAAEHVAAAPIGSKSPPSEVARVPSQRASVVVGMAVKDSTGTKIGTVRDLILSLQEGKVLYAAVIFSDALQPENRLSAVPWDRFDVRLGDDGKTYLVLEVEQTSLRDVPSFDQQNWPNLADSQWNDAIDRFFSRKPSKPGSAKEERQLDGKKSSNDRSTKP